MVLLKQEVFVIMRQTTTLIPPRKIFLLVPAVFFLAIAALAEYRVVLKDGQTILAKTKPVSMEGAYRFRGIDGQMQAVPVQLVDRVATEAANRDAASAAAPRRVITNEELKRGGDSDEINSLEGKKSNPLPPRSNKARLIVMAPTPPSKNLKSNGDDYWRARAQKIRTELAAVEVRTKEINDNVAQKKNDPIKYQMGTYSPYMLTGDYREELRRLDLRKQKLERDFAELEEEARKAGVPPGVLR